MAASSIPEYEFVGTSKSKSNRSKDGIDLGCLVTHKAMIFWKFACNKSKTKIYYGFSIKRETGCKASAVVLTTCSSIEEHNHDGDMAAVISERIQMEMAAKVEE